MQAHFAYKRLPFQFDDAMITEIHGNHCLSLQQLFQSEQTPTYEGNIVVGKQDGSAYGLVMVGGHGSIYRALMAAGSNPPILSNTDHIFAIWGVQTHVWHKNLTWLIIAGTGNVGSRYPEGKEFDAFRYNHEMRNQFYDNNIYRVWATPTMLAAQLVTWWPNRNFMKKH